MALTPSPRRKERAVKLRLLLFAFGVMLMSTLVMKASQSSEFQSRPGFPVEPALDCGGEPCDAVHRGSRAFVDRKLHGLVANGRACADCHMLTDHFQLSPANAEARFQSLQEERLRNPDADDPLFRPIDADDFRTNGENATDFSNLRENGLIRIVLPLPANIKLIDPATGAPSEDTFVDVWRMVPTVNDVALTGPGDANPWFRGPNATGGYQLDARVTTLQDQALGALVNHAQIQVAPPQRILDDLASFQRVLFTNPRVRALSDAISAGEALLPDPDPPLDELEQQGKAVFERACAQCHGGPSQSNAPVPVIRFHDIASQCPRPVDTRPIDVVTPARFAFAACPPRLARNARTYEITLPNGTRIRRTSSDPGRALLTGFVGGPGPQDDWNKFDMSGLRGISHTAPYFHNNSAATLEEVVDHYIEFFKRVRVNVPGNPIPAILTTDGVNVDRPLTSATERAALLAYLRKL
jgi:cytochrome c peroxidase